MRACPPPQRPSCAAGCSTVADGVRQLSACYPFALPRAASQAQEAKLAAKRESGRGALSNKSSEHFNIISLQYHDTPQGSQLQHKVRGTS